MPVDSEPSSAGDVVVDEDGLAHKLTKVTASTYSGDRYVSHFVTCPKAGEFRR